MAIFPNMVGAIWRGQVTIPSNAGTGATLLSLIQAAGYPGPAACAIKVTAKALDATTDRAAFLVASPRTPSAAVVAADFTTHGQPVPAGVEYAEPSDTDAAASKVRSLTAGTITAQAVVVF